MAPDNILDASEIDHPVWLRCGARFPIILGGEPNEGLRLQNAALEQSAPKVADAILEGRPVLLRDSSQRVPGRPGALPAQDQDLDTNYSSGLPITRSHLIDLARRQPVHTGLQKTQQHRQWQLEKVALVRGAPFAVKNHGDLVRIRFLVALQPPGRNDPILPGRLKIDQEIPLAPELSQAKQHLFPGPAAQVESLPHPVDTLPQSFDRSLRDSIENFRAPHIIALLNRDQGRHLSDGYGLLRAPGNFLPHRNGVQDGPGFFPVDGRQPAIEPLNYISRLREFTQLK